MPHLRAQKDDKRAGLLKIESKPKEEVPEKKAVQETPTIDPNPSIDGELEDSVGYESQFGQTILP